MSRSLAILLTVLWVVAVAQAQPNNALAFPDTAGRPTEELSIPLRANLGDPVSGLALTVLYDPSVLQMLTVSLTQATRDFTLQTNLTPGRVRIALASATPITGSAPILQLGVRLVGPAGTASALDLAAAVLNEGALPVATTNGLVTVLRELRISGRVLYYTEQRPVSGAVVGAADLASGALTTVAADTQGAYALNPLAPGDYQLSVTRTQNGTEGIDPRDVSDILRYAVGLVSLSANQQRCADVSGNGRVGTTDASLILRYLVGLESAFPAGPFWQFQPTTVTVSLLQNQSQDFTALLLGDVNADWRRQTTAKPVAAGEPRLRFHLLPAPERGAALFALSGEDLQAVRGGVLRLRYDPLLLEAVEVTPAGLTTDCLLAANLQEPGDIRMAFAGINELVGTGELFHLRFRERGSQGTATTVTIEAATLDGAPLSAAALEAQPYVLGAGASVPTAVLDQAAATPRAFGLQPAYPNPFNSATTVTYRLSLPGEVELSIFGVDGRLVARLAEGYHPEGVYQATWDGRDRQGHDAATGVYLLRLRAGQQTATGRLLLLR
ncbi:MAG: FlgD immunoglobulin-like domain containing protein [Candidatus Latescibacterota bacterium]|jgi:hypothetical protein